MCTRKNYGGAQIPRRPKDGTAYILRLSQLENSLFENIKKHVTVVREEWDVKKESKSDGSNALPKSPVMEVFDKNLKRSVDGLEAKLQVFDRRN